MNAILHSPSISCRNYRGSFIEIYMLHWLGALPVNSTHDHLMVWSIKKYLLLYSDRFLLAISLVVCELSYVVVYTSYGMAFLNRLPEITVYGNKGFALLISNLNCRKTWLCSLTARNSVTLKSPSMNKMLQK